MFTSVILSKLSTIAEVLLIAFEARTMAFSVLLAAILFIEDLHNRLKCSM